MSRRRTIAIYGGSFDPPHVAHVLGAAYVLSASGVDALWVLPTAQHAFAKSLSPFSIRMELARRAFAIFGDRVEVRDYEASIDAGGSTLRCCSSCKSNIPTRTSASFSALIRSPCGTAGCASTPSRRWLRRSCSGVQACRWTPRIPLWSGFLRSAARRC